MSRRTGFFRLKSQIKAQKKKIVLFLEKNLNFGISKKKPLTLKLFEFQQEFMIGTFWMKLILFEKIVSKSNFFISLENLETKFHFQNVRFSIVEFAFI